MNKVAAATTVLLDHELSELRLILERNLGVVVNAPCENVSRAAAELMESRGIGLVGTLLEQLREWDAGCETLAENLLDGETSFFRHPAAFGSLDSILMARISAQQPRSLRIWSAGCSTGEEAYSIALAVCDAFSRTEGGWKLHIVASDIRRDALEIARRGLYPKAALGQVPPPLIASHFARLGEHFLAKPRLRNLITFGFMNLAKPDFIGQFDCIFCMDVLPHFSARQRAALAKRLHLYLQPGGYLFLGQDEKLPTSEATFDPETEGSYTVYRKAMAAGASAGA
jgi:two-component system, chemotaxis family, CheB/CheR fusion protein